jgi:hypothetical protein
MQTTKSKSKRQTMKVQKLPASGKKQASEKANLEDLQELKDMEKKEGITLGKNFEAHVKKYKNADVNDYISFSKRTAQKVTISRHDGFLCEKFNVYTISHLAHVNNTLPEGTDLRNPDAIVENTSNPYELAKMWVDLKNDVENYISKESVISEKFYGLKKADLERFGDKNWNISKKWFFEDAIGIDVKVEVLAEESGLEIGIDDVLDFVKSYKPGEYKNPMKVLREKVEDKFKEVAGFQIKDYYAEHLIKSCEYDSTAVNEYPF